VLTTRVSYDEFRKGINDGADNVIKRFFRTKDLLEIVEYSILKFADNKK
jgi:hypothetical protein